MVFVHGLRGHPRRTWEYAARAPVPVQQSVGDAPASSKKKPHLFSRIGSKLRAPATTSSLGIRASAEREAVFWPAEVLPASLPNASIWVYGYNADVIGGLFQADNKNSVLQHGNDFMVKVERALKDEASCSAPLMACWWIEVLMFETASRHLRGSQPGRPSDQSGRWTS